MKSIGREVDRMDSILDIAAHRITFSTFSRNESLAEIILNVFSTNA
jgi:hypothetical protein